MSFTADISRFVEKANGNSDIVVRKIGLDLFGRVVRKTPVDTGRLRGNWFLTVNLPSSQYVESNLDKSGAKSISDAQSKIGLYNSGVNAIYITNNAPYAMRIETTGYSKQAPQGMARISVMEIAGKYS